MLPVKIYLSLAKDNHQFEHHVFRDVDTMRDCWSNHNSQSVLFAIIHVGYDRPEYDLENIFEFSSTLEPSIRPVFLTEASKWSLPAMYSNCMPCRNLGCKISNKNDLCPLYLGIKEWGYELENLNSFSIFSAQKNKAIEFQDWLVEVTNSDKELQDILIKHEIFSEEAYHASRTTLPKKILERCDKFRFEYYYPEINKEDPFSILSIAPKWLLEAPIQRISPTVRLQTVCNNNGINQVEDLFNFDEETLLRLKNFGKKSLRNLAEALINTVRSHKINPADITLEQHLSFTLNTIPENAKHIIYSRLGVNGKPMTLQQIGEYFKVTRERIRQIEKKFINKIIESETWDDLLIHKLNSLLKNRTTPLYLDFLEVEDPWFRGFGQKFDFLGSVIERFSNESINVIEFEGRKIISKATQEDFGSLLKEVRSTLSEIKYHGEERDKIKSLVQVKCIGFSLSELSDLIWDFFSDELHFAENDHGDYVLVGIGKSVDNIVNVVLEESETPIHYSEVFNRVQAKLNRKVDIRRVHNALTTNKNAKLFSRGTYGLEKHLNISIDEKNSILSAAEEIVLSGPELKQWHSSEILSILLTRDYGDLPEDLDQYSLSIVLESSSKLSTLGRHVWVSKYKEDLSTADRIQTANAFSKILIEAGCPLTTQELTERISKYRGVKSGIIQIHQTDNMIRVSPNTWGLIERDTHLTPAEISARAEVIYNQLQQTAKGIHISELDELLLKHDFKMPDGVESYVFLSLCQRDNRFKVWQGNIISLTEWGEPRKHSFASAFRQVYEDAQQAQSTDEYVSQMEIVLERKLDKNRVSNALSSHGVIYNRVSGLWSKPEETLPDDSFSSTEPASVQGG